ncbi:MAG: endolytic transglycosylase MltG [Rhizobiales bacterium]|nr:endolytic transglycosylase MltG [Hyphomicrobiales bacterium]
MTDTAEDVRPPRSVRVPAARTGRSALTRVLLSFLVLGLIVAVLAAIGFFVGYSYYSAAGPLATAKTFEIKRGLRTSEIAVALEDAGIVSDAALFSAAASLTGARGKLKAGEYDFPAGVSVKEALNIIVSGKARTYKILIPEGFTVEQALARVKDHSVLTGELTVVPPEGMIMPDTHVFSRGMTRDELVKDMQAAQEKILNDLWEKRAPNLPFDTKEKALILASIVEKETARADERPRVAAVFINRLRQGMRLQSDPTIIYGIVGGKGRLDRPITKQDIAEKTPYNTYRINGLPPGPISNPGRASIEAVLNPPETKEIYFVADGTGGHAFAETLEQHRANVENWRKIEKARKEDAEAEAIADAKVEPDDAAADAAAAEAEASAASQQPELPAPEETPQFSAGNAQPIPSATSEPGPSPAADATSNAAAASPVPEADPMPDLAALVAEAGGTEAAAAAPEPAPQPEPAVAATLQPGDVVTVAKKLVPIPVPKPKR